MCKVVNANLPTIAKTAPQALPLKALYMQNDVKFQHAETSGVSSCQDFTQHQEKDVIFSESQSMSGLNFKDVALSRKVHQSDLSLREYQSKSHQPEEPEKQVEASFDFSSDYKCETNHPEQELLDLILLLTSEEDSNSLNIETNYETPSNDPNETLKIGSQPLYTGAPISLHDSLVAILTFCLSFKLTGVGLQALLQLISLHLPLQTIFKKSTEFSRIISPTCKATMSMNITVQCVFRSYPAMKNVQNVRRASLQFFKFHPGGSYSDVYDGTFYQDLWKSGVLGNGDTLTFQWYTDGASLYTSSSTSVWPLYLTINELPFVERYKKENLLVPAIWVGPVKPPGSLLVSAIYPDMKLLSSGVDFEVDCEENKKLKGIVICGTGDTPGRSLMLNLVQFNGAHSCQECEDEGEPRFNCPGVRLYPFKPIANLVPRTLEKMLQYAKRGTEEIACFGVRGPSGLSKIMPNFLIGTAIDSMHQLYGGVTRKITALLLSTKAEDKKFSLSDYHQSLDNKLMSIKPPAHVPRVPRSLKELASWKMKELKAWLLDYSLPVLSGVLPEMYLNHHASLVAASQLLNSDTVSEVNLNTAKILLEKYVQYVADLYDPNVLTINFHLLVHLADKVQALGPLWVNSCFPLESINGIILSLVHGTRWAERQIASSMQICLGLPEIIKNLPESTAKQYCSKIINRHRQVPNGIGHPMERQPFHEVLSHGNHFPMEHFPMTSILGKEIMEFHGVHGISGLGIVNKSVVIGPSDNVENIDPEVAHVLDGFDMTDNKIVIVHSIKRGKYIYVAESSKLSAIRDSSVAAYIHDQKLEVGVIKTFLGVFNNDCIGKGPSCIYAVVNKLEVIKQFSTLLPEVFVPNVAEFTPTQDLHLISPEMLVGVCVKINFDDHLFISIPCNSKKVK
ncbi:Procathepsin L [Frankliniella fusca]|uniref:Procathepsin L n=1 Tax=Frankliniella fusca TaxID=407009 RepID=A0AAE1HHM3_9NEOP|nr:Procathepsin L [Frankliniella fusca]